MRIESVIPYFSIYTPQASAQAGNSFVSLTPPPSQKTNYSGEGVIVEISQQAKDAYNKSKLQSPDGTKEITPAQELEGCQTCKNRKYVDSSNDPSVSYQSPTHISPGQSASKVMAHEREHVNNEQAKAEREDRRIISQTVSLSMSTCPECGKMYVSGGVTRTVTADKKTETPSENTSYPDLNSSS